MDNLDNMKGVFGDPLDRLDKALEKWVHRSLVPKFNFKDITLLETSQLVAKLGKMTSHGHEGIDAMFVK